MFFSVVRLFSSQVVFLDDVIEALASDVLFTFDIAYVRSFDHNLVKGVTRESHTGYGFLYETVNIGYVKKCQEEQKLYTNRHFAGF